MHFLPALITRFNTDNNSVVYLTRAFLQFTQHLFGEVGSGKNKINNQNNTIKKGLCSLCCSARIENIQLETNKARMVHSAL